MSKAEIVTRTSDYSVAARATYIGPPIGRRLVLPTVKKNGCLEFATDGMTSDEMFLSRPTVIFLFY